MRNLIIDQLRGLCMLGVIGIHVGSVSANANNFSLYMLLEILSRYSVPSFFFVSGYGLFCAEKQLLNTGTLGKLDYFAFIKKRLRGAGLPYFCWSMFFTLYFYKVCPPGWVSLEIKELAYNLFYGLCCYHLYFMVILLWFYASYPLWRRLLVWMLQHKLVVTLPLLFLFNLIFNWFSINYNVVTTGWPMWAKNFYDFRLNYVPFHYLLIFMSGGLAALYWHQLLSWLRTHRPTVLLIYFATIAYDLGSCWYSYKYEGYNLEALANTYHQLSPQGLLYTIGSLLCFCMVLDWLENKLPVQSPQASPVATSPTTWHTVLAKTINLLSSYATLIYFIHPLFLDIYTRLALKFGIVLTSRKIVFLYFLLVGTSLCSSILLQQIFQRSQTLRLLFTGKK